MEKFNDIVPSDTNQETEDPFGTRPQTSIFVGIGI